MSWKKKVEERDARTARPFLVVVAIQVITSLKSMNSSRRREYREKEVEERGRLHDGQG